MIELNGNVITIDVNEAMTEGYSLTRAEIQKKALSYAAENARPLYDLMKFDGEILYVNKPKQLNMSEASESMSLKEFKEINELAAEADAFIDNLKYATSLSPSDEDIQVVVNREYPELTNEDFALTMSRARSIWRMDSERVQNVAELIEFASELKSTNQ